MKNKHILWFILLCFSFIIGCNNEPISTEKTAADILGNPDYLAMSYGGYRELSRETVPTVEEIKEDLKLLETMGVKIIRTYNVQQFKQAEHILKAIKSLKEEDANFEMYVMLGVWIDCKNAWTGEEKIHDEESLENNEAEINAAVQFANEYADIVKVIAVGNEAMVHWAASYYVSPAIILKWVNHLQDLKQNDKLPKDVWITSSDNYESWGGGSTLYHNEDLKALIKAVDYVSMHTYPFHETHYNPDFWYVNADEEGSSDVEKAEKAVQRAIDFAQKQYQKTAEFVRSVDADKPIHIGETGWASISGGFYGTRGSRAADEYKEKLYYDKMRAWTNEANISCFYFEAFDEQWKDAEHPQGSENHFGLMTIDGQAKYALWDLVDKGAFEGLTRNGNTITKTFDGDKDLMMKSMFAPPAEDEVSSSDIKTVNDKLTTGEVIKQDYYTVLCEESLLAKLDNATYPSAKLKLNAWEGTCFIQLVENNILEVTTGHEGESWWGCGTELKGGDNGENLMKFEDGFLNFDIKGETAASFEIGFQTGSFSDGNQVNNSVMFNRDNQNTVTDNWKTYRLKISELLADKSLEDVRGIIFIKGDKNFDGKKLWLRNIYYSQK